MRISVYIGDGPRAALTRIEVVVVVVVVVALASLLSLRLTKVKEKRAIITCVSKLSRVGDAFRTFANDHDGLFPTSLSEHDMRSKASNGPKEVVAQYCQLVSNVIGSTSMLVCPQDRRVPAATWSTLSNVNVSYFLVLGVNSTDAQTLISGDRNISLATNIVRTFSRGSNAVWIGGIGLHGETGNVLFADGHVANLNSVQLSNALGGEDGPAVSVAIP